MKPFVASAWLSFTTALAVAATPTPILSPSPSASPTAERLQVIATTPALASLLRAVGGEHVAVSSILSPEDDPHFFQPKVAMLARLDGARLIVRIGLSYEDGWLPPLVLGAKNGNIQENAPGDFVAAAHIDVREALNGPHRSVLPNLTASHGAGNPHFLLDPRNGARVANALADRLVKLDPTHAAYYREQTQTFLASLSVKMKKWKEQLAPLETVALASYHPSWTYFCDWAGCRVIGTLEPKPSVRPTAEHLRTLTGRLKEASVKLILLEPRDPRGAATELSQATGARILVVPSEPGPSESYEQWLDRIVQSLMTQKQNGDGAISTAVSLSL